MNQIFYRPNIPFDPSEVNIGRALTSLKDKATKIKLPDINLPSVNLKHETKLSGQYKSGTKSHYRAYTIDNIAANILTGAIGLIFSPFKSSQNSQINSTTNSTSQSPDVKIAPSTPTEEGQKTESPGLGSVTVKGKQGRTPPIKPLPATPTPTPTQIQSENQTSTTASRPPRQSSLPDKERDIAPTLKTASPTLKKAAKETKSKSPKLKSTSRKDSWEKFREKNEGLKIDNNP